MDYSVRERAQGTVLKVPWRLKHTSQLTLLHKQPCVPAPGVPLSVPALSIFWDIQLVQNPPEFPLKHFLTPLQGLFLATPRVKYINTCEHFLPDVLAAAALYNML